MKKFTAILLTLVMLVSIPFTAFAADGESGSNSFYKTVINILGSAVDAIVYQIGKYMPESAGFYDKSEDGFMKGTEAFLDAPADDAVFSLGYDSRSILTDGITGKMYVGGSISVSPKYATDVIDDLKVRTIALSDGSGRGISVIAEIDAYGLSLPDVREIRTRLASFSEEKGINSITVAVLHQHSAVDTLGMNGNVFEMLIKNPLASKFGNCVVNGKNDAYMENLFEVCTESIKAAVSSMTEGELYYGTADQSKYLYDKRAPYENDENFNRFRFVPADGSKETWLVSTEIHCVGNGAAGTEITGDWPYYAEQVINEKANADVMFYMGAQQSTSLDTNENTVEGYYEDMSRLESLKGFGKSIGNALVNIESEEKVEPLFNVRYEEVLFPVDNGVLLFGAKLGLFEDYIVKENGKYYVKSEVGYMELGTDLAFAVIPGELAAEIAYGGCLQADSWSGDLWDYKSLQQIVTDSGENRKLMVLDLANDQIGYIVPDNNYIPMIAEESQSIELVSLGRNTASTLVKAFEEIV